MNPVLETLCSDHANFAKLLNVIEQQAEAVSDGIAPDVDLLSKAVGYLEGYPGQYHHPLEDALCTRLQKSLPVPDPDVDGVLHQHHEIRQGLKRLKEELLALGNGDAAAPEKLAEVAFAFIDAEWKHMELERTALFPTAMDALTLKDWSQLEASVPLFHDPLFGGEVDAPLERLHQALLMCDSTDRAADVLRRG